METIELTIIFLARISGPLLILAISLYMITKALHFFLDTLLPVPKVVVLFQLYKAAREFRTHIEANHIDFKNNCVSEHRFWLNLTTADKLFKR